MEVMTTYSVEKIKFDIESFEVRESWKRIGQKEVFLKA